MADWQGDPLVQIDRRLRGFVPTAFVFALSGAGKDAPEAVKLRSELEQLQRTLKSDGPAWIGNLGIELSGTHLKRLGDISDEIGDIVHKMIRSTDATADIGAVLETRLCPLVTEAMDVFRDGFLTPILRRQNSDNGRAMVAAKEIQNISRQIYFISVSASVEASRAGDAGRGFTVISKQIRDLATATQEALRRLQGEEEEKAA